MLIARLLIKVQPNAGCNKIVSLNEGVWKIKIAAPPDKGKANRELIEFLSKITGLKKDSISIIKGETSHNKILSIECVDGILIEEALLKACNKNSK
jgi:uncharacterized protein